MLTQKLKCWVALATSVGLAQGQVSSSFPHDYPGKPSGGFSPEWQSCRLPLISSYRLIASTYAHVMIADFQVTSPLPNVTWTLPRSFAGNIPVNRPNHPNNTLFFWAFEHENGSLTAGPDERTDVPWGIWLNGG